MDMQARATDTEGDIWAVVEADRIEAVAEVGAAAGDADEKMDPFVSAHWGFLVWFLF